MNFFHRKSSASHQPPLSTARSGPESVASNSSYGRGFFEHGAYSVALKRCENGHDLAQQLAEMFEERAQLEAHYANQLVSWSNKWQHVLTKSQEYGTNRDVWNQTAMTGEQMAGVHLALSKSLNEQLVHNLRQWRKEHYEKSLMSYKKTKDFEKEFIEAQKFWNKLLDKINECKAAYHSACKAAKAAEEAERTASADQQKKYADKADVARREIVSAKAKYQQAINEALEQRPRYEAAMKEVFERTQAFEKKRLDCFREAYDEYARILEAATSDNAFLRKMNNDYRASILTHNPQQDLEWWDHTYGTQTNSRWPEYHEYSD